MNRALPKVEFRIDRQHTSQAVKKLFNTKKDCLTDVWMKKGLSYFCTSKTATFSDFQLKTISETISSHEIFRRIPGKSIAKKEAKANPNKKSLT